MKHIHARRKLKHRARLWAERYKSGCPVYLEPGPEMDTDDFAEVLRDVVSNFAL